MRQDTWSSATARVRPPAVAGTFYPDDPDTLREQVLRFLEAARTDEPAPKALIVPHAGYIYSGPVAAAGYATLRNRTHPIRRVVLLGPDHRVGFRGIAVPTVDYFATPLGRVPLDTDTIATLERLPQVVAYDLAHAGEHSLEVHLPFLQLTLGDEFELVPLVVSAATPEEVAEVLEAVWDGPETLIVVSSDLSHYHDYQTARRLDAATAEAIESLQPERLASENACGFLPMRGLLEMARRKGLRVKRLDLRNSGDTAGPKDQVVGYGAWAIR